jgi:hypothetical protein
MTAGVPGLGVKVGVMGVVSVGLRVGAEKGVSVATGGGVVA